MRINSDAAIAQARRDFRRYGNNWFNVFAAARRDENGILRLPREDQAPATHVVAHSERDPKTGD